MKHKVVALIPARSGSKRIPEKNVKLFFGHPLIAYTINSAIESGIFDKVYVATDSFEYAEISKSYGAEVPDLRPASISQSNSPDIEWVRWILEKQVVQDDIEYFCILRPTSPFRTSETIRRAWTLFNANVEFDTLRAVELCLQHPGKMWRKSGLSLTPLLPFDLNGVPWHSNQYSALPEIFVQNACIEFSKIHFPLNRNSITGDRIMAFETEGLEGHDLNTEEDWKLAIDYVNSGRVLLKQKF